MYIMEPYDDALREILKKGTIKKNRTGVDTIGINGMQRHYDISEYYPLLTGRKVWPKSVLAELLWFLSGSTNNNDLVELGAKFWTPWVDRGFEQVHGYEEGDFGPIYGFQLRNQGGDYKKVKQFRKMLKVLMENHEGTHNPECEHHEQESYTLDQEISQLKMQYKPHTGFDQLEYMQNEVKHNPYSRRILFSLWNMQDFRAMRLPPCHFTFQVLIDGKNRMSGILTQRSADAWLGKPANISFYTTLTLMFAHLGGYEPYEFVHNTNDTHLYMNQIEATEEYLARPKPDSPKININFKDILDHNGNVNYNMNDFEITDYNPLDPINVEPVV